MIARLFLFIVCVALAGITCTGQNSKSPAFKKSDYPADKFKISVSKQKFREFSIVITEVKALGTSDFACRAWIAIKRGDSIFHQRYFSNLEAVGGASGIVVPNKQPDKKHFIFLKFGGYDGRLLILDTAGKLLDKIGGQFYVSKNKEYLFSNYDSDVWGLTIYNLLKNTVVLSRKQDIENNLGEWYDYKGKFIVKLYDGTDKDDQQIVKIATLDLKKSQLITGQIDRNLLTKENRLAEYIDFDDCNCNCGQ